MPKADLDKGLKICSSCREEKTLDEFNSHSSKPDGLTYRCKDCISNKQRISQYKLFIKNREERIKRRNDLLRKKKECTKCGEYKSFDEFSKHSGCLYGLNSRCKLCDSKRGKEWYQENREKKLKQNAEWRENNPDKMKEYVKNHHKRYEEEHGVKYITDYNRKRKENDPEYKLVCNYYARMNNALDGQYKDKTTKKLLGCTYKKLRKHLEDQFDDEMTWDNYGFGSGKWNVDHIIPVSFFDHSCPHQRSICWHYSNLQPLWHIENIIKKDSLPNLFDSIELNKDFLNKQFKEV